MKALVTVILTCLLVNFAKADQLAYLSKDDATRAATYLSKHKKVILYCGCCDGSEPVKVKIIQAEVRYTGYENFYEVVITYKGAQDELKEPVDLAYIWNSKTKTTVGEELKLNHDPCKRLPR